MPRRDAASGIHAADDNHGTGKLRIGHGLQHFGTVAVLKHEIERHAVEPRRLDLANCLGTRSRQRNGVTGMFRGSRNQRPLRCVVIDDQKLPRAAFVAA
jgi:hypothetical protein